MFENACGASPKIEPEATNNRIPPQEVEMSSREIAVCSCCHLKFRRVIRTNQYTVSQATSVTAPREDICDDCRHHQGATTDQQLRKHQNHEQRLVEHLYAANQYARKAEQDKKDSREQVASALSSRKRMAECLKQVQDLHTLRPNGSCSCGKAKGCRTAEVIANNRWLLARLNEVDLPEDEEIWQRPTERLNRRAPWMEHPEDHDGDLIRKDLA